jgi:hypothetical protein
LTFLKATGCFLCLDKGVEEFLRKKAFDFEHKNVARTYLLLNADAFADGEIILLAYFTIAIKPLKFQEGVSKSLIKQIDGFSKHAESVGSILIGQLGKSIEYFNDISGKYILDMALYIVKIIFRAGGCRIVFLECQDNAKLISFYTDNGFRLLQSSSDGLLQMVRFL